MDGRDNETMDPDSRQLLDLVDALSAALRRALDASDGLLSGLEVLVAKLETGARPDDDQLETLRQATRAFRSGLDRDRATVVSVETAVAALRAQIDGPGSLH